MQGQYRTRFKHIKNINDVRDIAQTVPGVPADKIQAVTVCTIEDNQRRTIGIGYGFCSVKDIYSKEKGRRVALADALQDAFPYVEDGHAEAPRLNHLVHEARAAIWNTYFSRNEGRFDPRKRAM